MSLVTNSGLSQKPLIIRPPEKGSFPLDHLGECRDFMQKYVICLAHNDNEQSKCRHHAKGYFECRMQNELMAREEWDRLGFFDKNSTTGQRPTAGERQKVDEHREENAGASRLPASDANRQANLADEFDGSIAASVAEFVESNMYETYYENVSDVRYFIDPFIYDDPAKRYYESLRGKYRAAGRSRSVRMRQERDDLLNGGLPSFLSVQRSIEIASCDFEIIHQKLTDGSTSKICAVSAYGTKDVIVCVIDCKTMTVHHWSHHQIRNPSADIKSNVVENYASDMSSELQQLLSDTQSDFIVFPAYSGYATKSMPRDSQRLQALLYKATCDQLARRPAADGVKSLLVTDGKLGLRSKLPVLAPVAVQLKESSVSGLFGLNVGSEQMCVEPLVKQVLRGFSCHGVPLVNLDTETAANFHDINCCVLREVYAQTLIRALAFCGLFLSK